MGVDVGHFPKAIDWFVLNGYYLWPSYS